MEEKKQILDTTQQIIWSGLADFITHSNCDDIPGLIKAIYGLISYLGTDSLTEEEIKKLRLLNFEIGYNVKPYLLCIKKKHLIEEDVNSVVWKNFRKGIGKIKLIDIDLYIIFYKLFKQTSLINQAVHNQYITESRKNYIIYELEDQKEKELLLKSIKPLESEQ